MTWKITGAPGTGEDLLYSQAGTPTLDLRFASSKSLNDNVSGQNLITFTRASSGTYVGSDGLIKTALTDAPRFDHDPETGESLGLLIEEQRTNVVLRSEEFDNASWVRTNINTVAANVLTAPFGASTADEVILDSATGIHSVRSNLVSSSSGTYSFSVYLKAGTSDFAFVTLTDLATGQVERRINLSTGAIDTTNIGGSGSWTAPTGTVTPAGNGWYRVIVSGTQGGGSNVAGQVIVGNSSGQRSFAGNNTDSVYLWGAQLEAGAFPTSYIPTTTAAVTRNADVASIPASVFQKFFVASPASWLLEAYPISTTGNATYLEGFEGASLKGLTVTVGGVSGDRCRILQRHGSSRIDTGVTGPIVTPLQRFRASIGVSDTSAVYVDNQNITGASTTQVDWTTSSGLSIGSRAVGSSLPGTFILSRLCIFDRRLPNATLQAITT